MITTHSLGFPRIGAKRELKFALEKYWKGNIEKQELLEVGRRLRAKHWEQQSSLDRIPVGDFSFYDQVLDTSILVGNIPSRALDRSTSRDPESPTLDDPLDTYFRIARGKSRGDDESNAISASEMTKWFDTNYHYIVPEFSKETQFSLHAEHLIEQIEEASDFTQSAVKPVVLGPLTYLWLGKTTDESERINLLDGLIPVYEKLFVRLLELGIEWVQVDEPILTMELPSNWLQAFELAYDQLKENRPQLLLTTYFGELKENLQLACQLPVDGVHLDASQFHSEAAKAAEYLDSEKVLSLGVINGRNIWRTDLNSVLDWVKPIADQIGSRLWIGPSCSLLHVPIDLSMENEIDAELASWLAFAKEKIDEVTVLAYALNNGKESVSEELRACSSAISSRRSSAKIHDPDVKVRVASLTRDHSNRNSSFESRSQAQKSKLNLPLYPTTTIGSFPQTPEIRLSRRQFKANKITADEYESKMKAEIANCIRWQEESGLDVLVHGEAERNDMVEYFGEQLNGNLVTRFGWVQSYGSRCVKPPIIFGDVSRPQSMTTKWSQYADSLTDKPVKGMLTGPVTILNWSFVRDDQSREATCRQLALAIRDEALELEAAGIEIIQIDEPALREGLPLRKSEWDSYLLWAVDCFRLTANGVQDSTQIHTHMCYAEFNDIIGAIAQLDADVITIETSRSNMELLEVFREFEYPNDIGPGVYDIHSPNLPDVDRMVNLIKTANQHLPKERLWVNPDCGLKTRTWDEVKPALKNMVSAAKILRDQN